MPTFAEERVAPTVESSSSALRWGPILAGAFAASTVTVILVLVGSGLGLSMVSPWSGQGASITAVAASTAIWLIVVQWLSSAAGATSLVGCAPNGSTFTPTRCIFVTPLMASWLGPLRPSSLSESLARRCPASLAAACRRPLRWRRALRWAQPPARTGGTSGASSYFVDALFRPADPARLAQPGAPGTDDAVAQASRIVVQAAAAGEMSEPDRTYLSQLVAARAGLSEPDAKARVDEVLKRIEDAKVQAQEAADSARKAGATFALVTALSLIIGAFIASAAALLGGKQRDDDEYRLASSRPLA